MATSGEVKSDEVEKYRRGKAQGVDAVHHATVAFYHRAEILDAAIALNRRHTQPAGKAQQSDQDSQCLVAAGANDGLSFTHG